MKAIILLAILPLFFFQSNAQVKIGSAGNPNSNAVLELDGGTNKGFLLPRISQPQMVALNAAPDGLVIYNTTDNSIYLRKMGAWQKITDALDGNAGLTLPYSGAASSTAGNSIFRIQNTGAGDGIMGESLGTGTGGFFNSVNGAALITGQGNVGIGTINMYPPYYSLTAPQFPLDVSGRIRLRNSPGNSPGIWFDKVTSSATLEQSAFWGVLNDSIVGLYGTKNNQWKFFMNHDNNNFGIYNSNPRAPLSFQAATGNKIDFYYVNPGSMYGIGLGAAELQLYTADNSHHTSIGYGSNSNFTETFRVNNNGNTIISNPAALNTGVENASYFKTNTYYTGAIKTIGVNTAAARLGLFTYADPASVNLKERLSISDGGNVGIGNIAPTRPLSFPAILGKKISLYPGTSGDVGLSVEGNELRMYSDNSNAVITFGYDDFNNGYKENFRTTPWGNTVLSNPVNLTTGTEVATYFKTTNYFTGAIKTIGTGTSAARLGLFAYSSGAAASLKEYLSVTDGGNVGVATTTPNSKLDIRGSVSMPYRSITGNYTATDDDYSIRWDAYQSANSGVTVTLPSPINKTGRIYIISASLPYIDANAGPGLMYNVDIVNIGGNSIFNDNPSLADPDGISYNVLMNFKPFGSTVKKRKQSVTVQSDGSKWLIIDNDFQY